MQRISMWSEINVDLYTDDTVALSNIAMPPQCPMHTFEPDINWRTTIFGGNPQILRW